MSKYCHDHSNNNCSEIECEQCAAYYSDEKRNEFFNFDEVIKIECKKARADERRKFAEWITFYIDGYYFKSANEILEAYEKEQKNDN